MLKFNDVNFILNHVRGPDHGATDVEDFYVGILHKPIGSCKRNFVRNRIGEDFEILFSLFRQ